MNPVPLFLIIVTLPLLLGGCGENDVAEIKPALGGVNWFELEEREGIEYLLGSDTPYTGKIYHLYRNGQKYEEGNYKDGKKDGLWTTWYNNGQKQAEANFKEGKEDGLGITWHENGQKSGEANYKDGKLVGSSKLWNSKGEPVDTIEEALGGHIELSRNLKETLDATKPIDEKLLEVKDKVKPEKPLAETKPKKETPLNPLKYKISENYVTITGYEKSAPDKLIIPASIEGKPVTDIGWSGFKNNLKLTSITIPKSVTSIGYGAFENCTSLTNITIPDGVVRIKSGTFINCTNLTSITIPDSVTTIMDFAFENCTSLTSITIPDSVNTIENYVFDGCKSLTAVTFLGDAPDAQVSGENLAPIDGSTPTIYRKPEAKGWGDTWAGRPVKLISEKP